jgi:broad specificity phosphatase PhoE
VKTFYFVRHGRTEWNAIGRMQGQLNSSLDDCGRQQAETHGRLLATLGIEAIYASPLDRARETVDLVRRFVALNARFDPRIMEWHCGEWSGQLRAKVKMRWPEQWAALAADPYHYRGPGCENYPDMIARVTPFIEELLGDPARNVAVISHGMIGRVMVGLLMRFDETQMLGFSQPNDVIYRIRLPHTGTGTGTGIGTGIGTNPEVGVSVGTDLSVATGTGESAAPRLDRYVAGRGPIEGVVAR